MTPFKINLIIWFVMALILLYNWVGLRLDKRKLERIVKNRMTSYKPSFVEKLFNVKSINPSNDE